MSRPILWCAIAIVPCWLLSPAHCIEFQFTVAGTDQELHHVPLKVNVRVAETDVDSTLVELRAEHRHFMGQLTRPGVLSHAQGPHDRELHFVLPHLKANETLTVHGTTVASKEGAEGFRWQAEPGVYAELSFRRRPVFRYMHESLDESTPERRGSTYKVFHHVYDPAGTRFVTKGPGGLFPHHRGLFFGFNRISYGDQKADIWHCNKGEFQSHEGFVATEAGPVLGRHQLAVAWHGQDGKVFADEIRELTAYNVPGGLLIEFASVLKSKVDKVRLDGDPQHAGFQFRGSQDIPDKTKHLTYYLRPDGKGEPGKFRNWSAKADESKVNLGHVNLPWNAQSFVLDDQRFTCCYLDHPQNPKPARYSERDYGRFGSYFEFDLDQDHPLRLNYRIWLQTGEMTVAQVSQLSEHFVAAPIVRESGEVAVKELPVLATGGAKKKKVVFVAGTRSHGYGAHEHNAGSLLLAKHLQQAMPDFECVVHRNGWPKEGMQAFEGADAVVVYCDGGKRHLLNPHVEEFDKLMDRGVGLACIHYGVEVPKGKSGDAFVKWIGGYFETDWSVNPHWTADYTSFPDHPVANGVQPFEINDEWYFHMRFRDDMKGVTPILSAVPPASTMNRADGPHSGNPAVRRAVAGRQPQHMAWVAERSGGGRGFGFTGGHFHWNWGDDNFRKVVLNALVWIAHGEVPEQGVTTKKPSQADLEANQDEPKPRKKTAQGKRPRSRQPRTAAQSTPEQDASHDPRRAVTNMDVHPDLKANLFAAEPLLLSPSNIDVDHRGRVWVCEIVNYRAHRDKRPAGDRILILEDTDGDGVADNRKVFYQGRDIDSPHGICVLGNRVLVSAASKVTVFTDTNGDDLPDKKESMYTGIDGAQHDHGIHAFVFGPDGKLYFNFGNEGKQLKDAAGRDVVDAAGNIVRADRNPYQEGMVFRQNLDGTGLETLGWNFRNNWMVTVDSFGTLWQSDNDDDGNRGVRINYVMEFGNYGYKDEMTGAGWREARTGMAPQLPEQHWHLNDPGVVPNLLHTGAGSPTGITVYEGELLPESLRGQLIHCDAGPSVTRAYLTSEDGAGYRAEISNILEGTRDQWFRPSDVKVAPDGSLIVADWYDPGVGGHRMGDLDRGRIFRVVPRSHDGGYQIPQFDFDTAEGAVAALRNPNYAVRYLAWTALHKMGTEAEPALLELWNDANPRMRARALWLMGKIEGRGQHYVETASRDEDANIRIVSLRLARQLSGVDQIRVADRLANDPSSAVRRECSIAVRHHRSDAAAEIWARLAKQHDGKDRWYLEALGIGADKQWDRFLAAWMKAVDDDWNTPAGRQLIWRSRASTTAKWLVRAIAEKKVDGDEMLRYFRSLDFVNDDEKQNMIANLAFGRSDGDDARTRMVMTESIRRLSPSVLRRHPRHAAVFGRFLDDIEGSSEFVDLVSRFNVTDRYGDLLAIAQNDPDGQLGVHAMRTLLANDQSDMLRAALKSDDLATVSSTIQALGNSSENGAADLLRSVASDAEQDLELRRVATRSMAKIRKGAMRLIRQAESGQLDDRLKEAAAAELTRSRWGDLRTKALELFPLPPSKGAEKLPPIQELAKMSGDVAKGQLVYQKTGTCAKCHVVGDEGKEVGPNLSEIGSKLSREAMFESILFPSAGISHNYESYTLITEDGNVVNGLVTSQTAGQVVIKSDDGIARTYQRDDIHELRKQPISLMPADMQGLMTQQELVDLVEYLMTLRKTGF